MASIDGLLSEVSQMVATRLTIRAAEQAFYGGKTVYTDVPLASTSTGKGQECKGKQDKKGGQLENAIQNAKAIVNNALGGHAVSAASNDKLVAEVEKLKKEQSELKNEVAQLKALVEKLTVTRPLRFDDAHDILILGDGNLSFSLALAKLYPSKRLTASVLDSESDFRERYKFHAEAVLGELASHNNASVQFSVDATKLDAVFLNPFDAIVMNFPHPGGKTNLKMSRKLLHGICASMSHMKPSCRFHLTLARGQSGCLEEQSTSLSPPVHHTDSWQVMHIAAEYGLIVDKIVPFFPMLFPGYSSSGYKSTFRGFDNYDSAQRIVIRRVSVPMSLEQYVLAEANNILPIGVFHPWRTCFLHDLSFLFTDLNEAAGETIALDLVKNLCGRMLVNIHEVQELRSMCPDPYLPNRIYRLAWQSANSALSKKMCNELQEELRSRIVTCISLEKLPLILT